MLLVLVLILLWGLAGVWRTIQPIAARLVINGITDRVLWGLPVSHRYVRDHSLAVTFDFIADALHAGQPIDHAVDQAANLHVNRVVQNRLGEFAVWLGSGTPLHSAARQSACPGWSSKCSSPRLAANKSPRSSTFWRAITIHASAARDCCSVARSFH